MDVVFGDFSKMESNLGNEYIPVFEKPKDGCGLITKNVSARGKAALVLTKGIIDMNRNVDIVFELEDSSREDFIHHRNSGLNHVLAKDLFFKEIIVGFSFSLFLRNPKVLGRMKQNVKLCRKYDVKMIFASFARDEWEVRSLKDLESFARVIGMSTKEIKDSYKYIKDRLVYNDKKMRGLIPTEGVEIID